MNITNKIVLMTGGLSGLGQHIVKGFLDKGAKVCMTDIHIKEGIEAVKSYQKQYGDDKIIFTKCDVTKDEDFDNAFNDCEKRLGVVDIVINSAMYIVTDYEKSTQINYLGAVRGTETAFRKIGKHNGGKGGNVINVGSLTGLTITHFMPFYAPAKAAVIHYSRCVGHPFHYAYTGVSVQSICQSAINTEVMDQLHATTYTPQTMQLIKKYLDDFPKVEPEDIVKCAFKLLEDNRPGAALAVEVGKEPFYVGPALGKEFY